MAKYVISVKKTRDCFGRPLAQEEQYWDYAQYVRGDYPAYKMCFGGEQFAVKFDCAKEAKEWYIKAKPYLKKDKVHDWSTLAIRRMIYHKVETLTM